VYVYVYLLRLGGAQVPAAVMVIGGHSNAFQSQEEVRTKSAF
jgi:hypothetical protein